MGGSLPKCAVGAGRKLLVTCPDTRLDVSARNARNLSTGLKEGGGRR